MPIIIGAIIVLGSVAGGYVMSHGALAALWQPYELVIIGGAAFGAFIISNPAKVIKASVSGALGAVKGSRFSKKLYLDMLALMYDLFSKIRKEGMMAIEEDIDDPHASPVFQEYPAILKEHHAIEFICDYLRLMVAGNMNPFEIENLMDMEIEAHHHENEIPATAVSKVADALPGFGIVAAVLGIVITMASLGDGDTAAIGAHVAAALVGTFLGILLAYGFVAPLSTAMEHMVTDETKFYECMKTCLMASLNGAPPQVAVEHGRKVMYPKMRPSFQELEDHVKKK